MVVWGGLKMKVIQRVKDNKDISRNCEIFYIREGNWIVKRMGKKK